MKEKEQRWRRLDNSAKLFPIISSKKFSNVFRISCVLKDDIEEDVLKEAVITTINIYNSFKVRMRKGFFWYYFEYNPKDPIVEKERTYPCKYIDKTTNNDYLFKVTYYKNKVNLEMFHSVTDGNGALELLKAICYKYIELKYGIKTNNLSDIGKIEINNKNTEDSYIKNYQKNLHGKNSSKKAFILKGKKNLFFATKVTHFNINLKQTIKTCRRKKVTVTQYLTAILIKSIYESYQKNTTNKKPIKVCIPVNLKKYFDSTTISNFFSYITIEANRKKIKFDNLDDILEFVKEEFKSKLTKEEISKTMSSTVNMGTNIIVRFIPLFLKKITLKISYQEIAKYTTTTFSNIGKINVLKEYEEYIQNFYLLVATEKAEKIKVGACSYGDNITFTVTSILQEDLLEKEIKEELKHENIENKTITNEIYKNKEGLLYPKVMNMNKSKLWLKLLIIISILIGVTSLIINNTVGPKFHWSWIVILGIVYSLVTIWYSIKKNVNIASHVMVQTICATIIVVLLDWIIGYNGWSIKLALPILCSTANITMLILLIINQKGYPKYALYQFIIFVWSLIPVLLLLLSIVKLGIFIMISLGISTVTIISTILFCGKEMKEELKRRFHF